MYFYFLESSKVIYFWQHCIFEGYQVKRSPKKIEKGKKMHTPVMAITPIMYTYMYMLPHLVTWPEANMHNYMHAFTGAPNLRLERAFVNT